MCDYHEPPEVLILRFLQDHQFAQRLSPSLSAMPTRDDSPQDQKAQGASYGPQTTSCRIGSPSTVSGLEIYGVRPPDFLLLKSLRRTYLFARDYIASLEPDHFSKSLSQGRHAPRERAVEF